MTVTMPDQQRSAPQADASRYLAYDAARDDAVLMREVTVVNTLLGRYLLRFLDADAGRADQIEIADETALADQLATVAKGIHRRAERRARYGNPRPLIDANTVDVRRLGR